MPGVPGDGARGQTGSFPYSESLQSLRAKRLISHENQKSFRLSPCAQEALSDRRAATASFDTCTHPR